MKNLFVLFSLILLLSFSLKAEIPENLTEKFDPALVRLNDLEKLEAYIDSLVDKRGIKQNSKDEIMLINSVIEDRFYHWNYSRYSVAENWLAFAAGKLLWWHLNAIVIADDLLKYPMAACSQQAIVMMKILKNKGYEVRKLGLKGHFVHEVFYDGDWHLFDPNKETTYQGLPHNQIQIYFNNGDATIPYVAGMSVEETQEMFSQMEIGEVNEFPAKRARLFHQVTKFLSYPVLVLVCLAAVWGCRKLRSNKIRKNKIPDQIEEPELAEF
jgi:hypothetical protein